MSKKLMLIILPVAALATFGGAFMAAYLTKPETETADEPPVVDLQARQQDLGINPNTPGALPATAVAPQRFDRLMSDQQLRDLVREVKERIRDYETKLAALGAREKRLQSVQDDLQQDIKTLNDLRVDVAAAVAELKQQRTTLEESRIRIKASERDNLATVAKTFEGMAAESASTLIVNICENSPTDPSVGTEEVGEGYAVKLLHLMKTQSRAKVLVELVTADAELAGRLSVKLNRILEVK